MDKYRLYVEGGEVISKNDGDRHKIPEKVVAELYCLIGDFSIPSGIEKVGDS